MRTKEVKPPTNNKKIKQELELWMFKKMDEKQIRMSELLGAIEDYSKEVRPEWLKLLDAMIKDYKKVKVWNSNPFPPIKTKSDKVNKSLS